MDTEKKTNLWKSVYRMVCYYAIRFYRSHLCDWQKNGITEEDYVQEALLRAWQLIDLWVPSKAKLTTYIYRSISRHLQRIYNEGGMIRRPETLALKRHREYAKKHPPAKIESIQVILRDEPQDRYLADCRYLADIDNVDNRVTVEEILKLPILNPKEKELLKLWLSGKTPKEIDIERGSKCKKLGHSASAQMTAIIAKIREHLMSKKNAS